MAKKRQAKRRKSKKEGQKPSSGNWIISAPTLYRFSLIEISLLLAAISLPSKTEVDLMFGLKQWLEDDPHLQELLATV